MVPVVDLFQFSERGLGVLRKRPHKYVKDPFGVALNPPAQVNEI